MGLDSCVCTLEHVCLLVYICGDESSHLLSLCVHTSMVSVYVENSCQSHCCGFQSQLIAGCCSGLKSWWGAVGSWEVGTGKGRKGPRKVAFHRTV